jgi:uncharacterized protein
MWFLVLLLLGLIGCTLWLYQRKSPVERDQHEVSEALWVDQVDAELALAQSLFEGQQPDYPRAYTLLQTLSQQHELPEAYVYMAFMQQRGLGRPIDVQAAKSLLETAHQRGSDEASFYLAEIYQAENNLSKALYWYQYAVARGNQNAQYQLAEFYLQGIELEIDLEKAKSIWIDAAKKGHIQAQYRLGYEFWQGQYFAQDQLLAKQYLHQAAEQQHAEAIAFLHQIEQVQGLAHDAALNLQYIKQQAFTGDCKAQYQYCLAVLKQLIDGEQRESVLALLKQESQQQQAYALSLLGSAYYYAWGVETNTRQAFQYWSRAAAKNEPIALCSLAMLQQQGILLEQSNMQQAFKLYQQAAETGSETAQFLLAHCYVYAEGTAAQPQQAIALLQQAAAKFALHVHTKADILYSFALFYADKLNVFEDQAKAHDYLALAAQQGSIQAALDLAYAYLNAQQGLSQNDVKAREYFTQAMQQGSMAAQTQLAILMLAGRGGEQDQAQALVYLQQVAEQEDSLAKAHLARCYEQGLGVEKDLQHAFALYQQAMDVGEAEAFYHMGRLHAQGHGVVRNVEQALSYLQQAQYLGHPLAAKLAQSLQQEYAV